MRLILLLILMLIPVLGQAATTSTLTQYGVTWTFVSPVQYGQFVNGDYWVVDNGDGVEVNSITPETAMDGDRRVHGSMLNPRTAQHGYDSLGGPYSDSKNVAIGIAAGTPLTLSPDQSLVSTISNYTLTSTRNGYVADVAVLTCLSTEPPANTFRPGISTTTKTLHNYSSVNTALLKSLPYSAGAKPNITTYANYFKMTWLTHDESFLARYMHPENSFPSNYYYPLYMADAALMLHMDYTLEEKRDLLIGFIQLGIDIYSFIESGAHGWPPNGGHSNGKKWPILFAGLMLDYPPMKNIGAVSGDYLYDGAYGPSNPPLDYIHFGEDGQTFYVAQDDIDVTGGTTWIRDVDVMRAGYTGYLHWYPETHTFGVETKPALTAYGPWNPDARNDDGGTTVYCEPYTAAMIGMPEWGITYSIGQQLGDSSWASLYRGIASGARAWMGTAMAARFMGAKELWNHDVHFDYLDRYAAIDDGLTDPFGYTVSEEALADGPPTTVTKTMWDDYRNDYDDLTCLNSAGLCLIEADCEAAGWYWYSSSCHATAEGASPTCSDSTQNGDETGVDCGGSCPACPPEPHHSLGTGTATINAGTGTFTTR